MLRLGCRRAINTGWRRQAELVRYASGSSPSHQPNAPLELDPAFQALLRDVEMSLRSKAPHDTSGSHGPRELELFPRDPHTTVDYLTSAELDAQDESSNRGEGRKSPAAAFGSQRIGAVVLPFEMQSAISRLVADSDKPTLRQDAKRLFSNETVTGEEWNSTFDMRYNSAKEAGRHALRDATAFATVALPSHYSVIYAVLDHIKRRMGADWQVDRVIDWGAATGSGLWASGHVFQRRPDADGRNAQDVEDIRISQTSLSSYLGIDKREGLVRIGKRIIRDLDMGSLHAAWQKSFHDDDAVDPVESSSAVALSAFLLSSLPTPVDRKIMIKEMWESGAEVIVLIDHSFENIAEAREQFLKLGKKEVEDPTVAGSSPRGAHVVAPCPHDGACPLYHPGYGKLQCTFSQRMQRPEFVRKTKHSGTGHENMDYSYVVIRRGPRPAQTSAKAGRAGDIGLRELAKRAADSVPMNRLSLASDLHDETELSHKEESSRILESSEASNESHELASAEVSAEVTSALRQEAYSWPRLIFPPIKRSGHVILDVCHPQGQIMRMTIPKSQGKQPYYDARKSSWGDIFPHEPKNPPQLRRQPAHPGDTPSQGQDIGKRRHHKADFKKASYAKLAEDIKERRRDQRRARRIAESYDT
ncbi:Rsm22-domain-containing protein [Dichomitus squalens]|uniref:Rsm22-domain-containing protein n=1 Tax=Dichomitus squalens TaxID=114155 RepID=A0A4V2K1X4_9APHY|nr:Rsm22-domain-containing protein [Dichomitus squalens]TBU50047.1 Rsm22-domain-containing protein [Dichomitus squalens]